MKKKILLYICLLIILTLAFIIRYRGIRFGFPLIVHPDEPVIVNSAINIVKTGDLNPYSFLYPSLYIYMQALVYIIIFSAGKLLGIFQQFTDIEITTLLFGGRMLTIILSVGTIYFVYLIGLFLFNRWAAIISTLFIAASYLHIDNSFTITTDSPMAFWIILSFFISVLNCARGPKLIYYLLNGVFVGLAIGTKYTALWCIFPMIYAHLHHVSFSLPKLLDRKLLLGFLLIPLTFILTTPFSVLYYKTFISYLQYQHEAYSLGHPGYESAINSYGFYFKSLISNFGVIPLIMGGIGIIFLWINDKRKTVFLTSFPLFYFLFLGAYKVRFDRNMVCVVPFLALLGGYGVFKTVDFLKNVTVNHKLRYAVYVLLIVMLSALIGYGIYGQAHRALNNIRRITLPDTRWISKIWIEKNFPRGAKIGRGHYTPPIDPTIYKVTYLGYFGLIQKGLDRFDYIIASSYDYARFTKNPMQHPIEAQKYKKIFSKYELVKEFVPDNKETGGPIIRIYRVQ